MLGPSVKKLIFHKMALIAVPPGGGMGDAVQALSSAERLGAIGREARDWVEQAIAVVKTAPDNPYGDDDEAIAAELLRRIEERKR